MKIGKPSSPIDVHWDIGAATESLFPSIAAVCDDIVLFKILRLHILEQAAAISRATFAILQRMKGGPAAVQLTVPRSALNGPALDVLRDLKVRTVLVRITSKEDLASIIQLQRYGPVGISLEVNRNTIGLVPQAVTFCMSSGIGHLDFPVQRTAVGQECFVPSVQELSELSDAIESMRILSTLKLVIHDPFLWRAFHPLRPYPGDGCQAANTMLYIAPSGLVHPCPSLPLPIGSIADQGLKDIMHDSGRSELRERLHAVPGQCLECRSRDSCRGGCRGRAFSLTGSLERRDPACREKD